jgi:glycine/serine hydroxymethyltransferase
MKEDEMKIIANIFTEAIKNKDDEKILLNLKNEVLNLCKFPIYKN